MNPLDLTLLSIYRIDGQEWPLLPGLLAQNPPKRTARGRDQDRLLVYLTLAGNVSHTDQEYAQIVNLVAKTFYDTAGSLTFALKTAAGALNSYLVDRNMKSTGKGLFSMGALVLCNLRGNSMYIVQAGPTHVYQLGNEPHHFYDPLLAGKGLGLSQTARMYFAQAILTPGDRLLFCAALPPAWEKSINEMHVSLPLESARRHLLATTETNASALLLHVSEGSGLVNILGPNSETPGETPRSIPGEVKLAVPPPVEMKSPPVDEKIGAVNEIGSSASETGEPHLDDVEPGIPHASQPSVNMPGSVGEATPTAIQPPLEDRVESIPVDTPRKPAGILNPASRAGFDNKLRQMARSLALSIQNGRSQVQKLTAWSEKTLPRLLPENDNGQRPLFSRSWAIFLTIALPVVLFLSARIVYSQLGFEAQYKIYYDRAVQAAQQASTGVSPEALRVAWQAALDWLDRADQYQDVPSSESQQLRQQAQSSLDNLNKVVRASFAPAFSSPLGRSMQVTRIVATDSDVYLLDSARGSVTRGVYTGKNFELDTTFECGPGNYKGIRADKLIEIVALPRPNDYDATLLGIDVSGNILYCSPGQIPSAAYLQMPDTGWKGITSITYDNYILYVLDAPARAVWVYQADGKLNFPDKPFFFFAEQVPVMLEQAIGMAVNNDDLYLLHQDGHLTTCTRSNLESSPTRCNDPALFIDTRPGYQGGMRLSDGIFTQIAFTSPPDPSVALLEPTTQSIFRFSPSSLELQNQVRAAAGKDNTLPKGLAVTAMAFSPNKLLFLFIDGQLYYSVNVP